MRHQVAGKQLGRNTKERKALLRNLLISLVTTGHMTTTITKAKVVKRLADRMIHQAQTDSLASRRLLHRFFGRRDVVNTLVERIAPANVGRTSGFTTSVLIGSRRGDNSEMMKVALISQPSKMGTLKSGKVHAEIKKVAKAAVKPAAKKVAPAKATPTKVTKAKVAKPAAKTAPKTKTRKAAPAA